MTTEHINRKANEKPRLKRKHAFSYALIFVFVPILTLLIGRSIDALFDLPRWPPFPFSLVLGLLVLFSGLSIGIKATRLLYSSGRGLPWGEFSRGSQTKKIVDTGLYAYTRNPMTLGYSLLPCGMGLMFQSVSMAFLITAITLTMASLWAKLKEEPGLERRFGTEYVVYKQRTPFLIPKLESVPSWFLNVFF